MEKLEKVSVLGQAIQEGAIASILSAFPVAGPAISGFLTGATAARRENRLRSEIANLDGRLSSVQDQMHEDFIKSAEFSDVIADAMSEAIRFESKERRTLYTSVVVAAAVEGPGSQVIARRMMRRIEALDPIHFRFLKALAISKDAGPVPGGPSTAQRYVAEVLASIIDDAQAPDRSEELLQNLLEEGLLSPSSLEELKTVRSTFSAADARRWISNKGWETLRYLWPENRQLSERASALSK